MNQSTSHCTYSFCTFLLFYCCSLLVLRVYVWSVPVKVGGHHSFCQYSLCVCCCCCAVPLNVRYPAASIPDGRLHSKVVLRGITVLSVHLPVDGEGSCQRQPGQPDSHDEPQHQLPARDEKQALRISSHILHHSFWPLRRCFPLAGHL